MKSIFEQKQTKSSIFLQFHLNFELIVFV